MKSETLLPIACATLVALQLLIPTATFAQDAFGAAFSNYMQSTRDEEFEAERVRRKQQEELALAERKSLYQPRDPVAPVILVETFAAALIGCIILYRCYKTRNRVTEPVAVDRT